MVPPEFHSPSIEAPALTGRVLLAESSVDDQRLLSRLLRQAGLEVDIVDNGRAAVEVALARDYALVLMAVQIPDMDGVAATVLLQAAGCVTPVVALTAQVTAHEVQRCQSAGCVDVLAKPVDRQRFYATVARCLRRPRPALSAEALMRMELHGLFAEFRSGLPGRLAEIEAALQAGELERLSRLVHTLKGAAGSYGHPEITRICADIEKALRAHAASAVRLCCASLRTAVEEALRKR